MGMKVKKKNVINKKKVDLPVRVQNLRVNAIPNADLSVLSQ